MRAMGSTEAAAGERRWPASLIVSGVLALVVAVVGWIGVAAWLSSAARPPSGEWRTEQFRDITFRVPVEWGYAGEPGPEWCGYGGFRNPRLRPDQQRPYVSLGAGNISFGCPWPQPDALISEHVAAQSTAAVKDTFEQLYGIEQPADGQHRLARGFSEIIRTVGTTRLRVVSRNLDLARQIADSAAPTGADEACRPTVDRQTDRAPRPDPSFDVRELDSVRSITLCQYDGSELQARTDLGEAEAGQLITTIAASPVERGAACPPEPSPDLVGARRPDPPPDSGRGQGDQSVCAHLRRQQQTGPGRLRRRHHGPGVDQRELPRRAASALGVQIRPPVGA